MDMTSRVKSRTPGIKPLDRAVRPVPGLSKATIVGFIAASSQTMADALAQVNRYTRLGTDFGGGHAGDRLVLRRELDALWLVDTRKNPNDFPELTESSFARTVCDARRTFGER